MHIDSKLDFFKITEGKLKTRNPKPKNHVAAYL